jgi:hypothetical protein
VDLRVPVGVWRSHHHGPANSPRCR